MRTMMPKNRGARKRGGRFTTSHKIGLGLFLFFLLTLLGTQIFLHQTSVGSDRFIPGTMILMGLTALIVVMVLVLGFVLARNVVKLYFERRSNLLGSKFKTRLLVAFGALALAPAVLQMFLAYSLISKSIDQWFGAPAKQMMDNSVSLADTYYREMTSRVLDFAQSLAPELAPLIRPLDSAQNSYDSAGMERLLESRRREFPQAHIRIYDAGSRILEASGDFRSDGQRIRDSLASSLQGKAYTDVDTSALLHDTLLCAVPVRQSNGHVVAAVVVERFVPQSMLFKAHNVREAYDKYAALEAHKFEYRWTYFLIITLATIMILFGFSWFAIYVAKRITVPIQALAEGAEQVAAGRLDYRVRCETSDEVQNLVESFNHMIQELEQNRRQIDVTHQELQRSHVESEERRRYIETLLENIPSGVISTDANSRITTVNHAAADLLRIDRERAVGRELKSALESGLATSLEGLTQRARFSGQAVREIEWFNGQSVLHIAASLNYLQDARGKFSGAILLLDDLTDLINAEKMAAWQEVARRLAHEIRNPLTPIQLSAERIRRHVGMSLIGGLESAENAAGDGENPNVRAIVEEGTQLIIQEARSLKRLVEEFSRFARMPAHRPVMADINKVIEAALMLYEGRLQGIRLRRDLQPDLPALPLDTEQMKRVFVNLFDNALAAMLDVEGKRRLSVSTRYSHRLNRVRIEVADTGCGIGSKDREELFLPYFSRRRKGTGLGLTLVRQIINEHEGRIHTEDNPPRGVRMVIDLPVVSTSVERAGQAELPEADLRLKRSKR